MSTKVIDYVPTGICARQIKVELEDDVIKDVIFMGGCDGNHKGIVALCKGLKADEAIKRLSGITCGFKKTSCPDQLACALKSR